jgi:hypothetical protein
VCVALRDRHREAQVIAKSSQRSTLFETHADRERPARRNCKNHRVGRLLSAVVNDTITFLATRFITAPRASRAQVRGAQTLARIFSPGCGVDGVGQSLASRVGYTQSVQSRSEPDGYGAAGEVCTDVKSFYIADMAGDEL